MENKPKLSQAMPFFIVDNLIETTQFYAHKLGFEITALIPEINPIYAIVNRDNVGIHFKHIAHDIHPTPNHSVHDWARWDVYIYTPDPDSLYDEYKVNSAIIHKPLSDTDDGVRAFEVKDNNGYVLCFGRPL